MSCRGTAAAQAMRKIKRGLLGLIIYMMTLWAPNVCIFFCRRACFLCLELCCRQGPCCQWEPTLLGGLWVGWAWALLGGWRHIPSRAAVKLLLGGCLDETEGVKISFVCWQPSWFLLSVCDMHHFLKDMSLRATYSYCLSVFFNALLYTYSFIWWW